MPATVIRDASRPVAAARRARCVPSSSIRPSVLRRGDASWARLATAEGGEVIDALEADVHQLRVGST